MNIFKFVRFTCVIFSVVWSSGSGVRAEGKAVAVDRKTEVESEIAAANAWIKKSDEGQYQAKMAAMKKTPFTFYRATDHLFYHDLGSGHIPVPDDWKKVDAEVSTWISGDFHLQNVGFVDSGNGSLSFEPNDFDESMRAPFYWDLIRCVASLFIVVDSDQWPIAPLGEKNKERLGFAFSQAEAKELAEGFLKAYFETATAADPSPLNESEVEAISKKLDGWMAEVLAKIKKDGEDEKSFWDHETGGARDQFKPDPERLREVSKAYNADVEKGWPSYQKTAAAGQNAKPGYFECKAKAERLGSGLGSLGVTKIYVLIEGPTKAPDDNILLECKESRPPAMVLEGALQAKGGDTEAERVSRAMHKMVGRVDGHEGWFAVGPKSYHVTRISPAGDGMKLGSFKKKKELREFLTFAAMAIANAHRHAEAGFAMKVQDFLDKKKGVKTTLLKLGQDYGEQVVKDFALFTQTTKKP